MMPTQIIWANLTDIVDQQGHMCLVIVSNLGVGDSFSGGIMAAEIIS